MNFEYTPSREAIKTVRTTPIVLLVGITGAGKDTIQSKLLELTDYHKIVTHTTRSPRINQGVMESDGDAYHFVTHTQMQELITSQQMIEYNEFGGNIYGTSVAEFERAHATGKIAVGDIDIHGIAAFHRIAPDGNVKALFIVPPDYATWRERLAKRYATPADFDAVWQKRRTETIIELETALAAPHYHFIINDDLARAVHVADRIAHRSDAFRREDAEARLKTYDLLDAIKNT